MYILICVHLEAPLNLLIYICIYRNTLYYTYACHDMGWLWLVESIKLQVSFAKEPYKTDNILPKRRII